MYFPCFILPNSPAEKQKMRVKVLEAYEAARIGKTPFLPNLFNATQSIIHHDLTFDEFPRFVETDMFNDLMKHEFETSGEKKFKETYLLTQEQVKENIQTFDAYKQFKEGLDTELKNSKTNLKLDTTKLPLRPITGCSLHRSKSLFQKNTSKREILGADAVKWIQNYRFTNEELPVKNLLNYFISKKFLIPKDSKKSKFDPKGIYSFGFKKKIIIIGGGFSGMFAAKGLRDDFDVYFKYKTLKEDVEETYIETEAVIKKRRNSNEEEDSEESRNDQDILNAFINKDSEEDLNNIEEKLQKPAPKKRLNIVISFTKDESDAYSNFRN
eukprot:gene7385-11707_t